MNVKLIYASPLWLIANGIRYSHANWGKSDTDNILELHNFPLTESPDFTDIGVKDFELIKRVGFHMNHSSVLEHSLLVFDVEMSTKALLEESRHRIGVSQTVTSSRYTLDIIDIRYEKTGDKEVDYMLHSHITEIKSLIHNRLKENGKLSKKDMDKIAMLLPQAFLYRLQLTFNLRSLIHFLELRTSKSAHNTIRKIAFEIIESLPMDYKELIFENKLIKDNYEKQR